MADAIIVRNLRVHLLQAQEQQPAADCCAASMVHIVVPVVRDNCRAN